jgi:hypothetical protein
MEGVPSELRCGSPVLGQDRNTREQSPFEKRTRVRPKYPSKAKASEPQAKATEEGARNEAPTKVAGGALARPCLWQGRSSNKEAGPESAKGPNVSEGTEGYERGKARDEALPKF